MKLACADFTWPLLSHHSVLALIGMLDVEGLDLGVFGNRSHIRPEMVRGNIPYWSGALRERIANHGLELADFFFQPWSDFETMAPNNPDAKQQEEATLLYNDMLQMAHLLEAPGITMLPGVRFGDEPWDTSIRRSAEALKWRVEAAREKNIRLSVEGHMGSNVDTPDKLAQLVDLTPGLELTLDYTHFTHAGIPDGEIEPLLHHARHFHCRGAAPGHLQTIFEENTIDYARVIRRMQEIGYDGYFAIEYAWTEWGDFKRTDNTSETIRFRDMARALLRGDRYQAQTTPV